MVEQFEQSSGDFFAQSWSAVLVPTSLVPDIYPKVLPFLEEALAHSPVATDLYEPLVTGAMGLLVVKAGEQVTGAAVLQFVEVPGERTLRIVLMARIHLGACEVIFPMLKELARENGAQSIECFGREGFKRWAKSLGLRPVHVIYRAEV